MTYLRWAGKVGPHKAQDICQKTRNYFVEMQEVLQARVGARGLFQLCVFRFGFLQNGDVGVGVFPDCEEILIGGVGFGEGVRL